MNEISVPNLSAEKTRKSSMNWSLFESNPFVKMFKFYEGLLTNQVFTLLSLLKQNPQFEQHILLNFLLKMTSHQNRTPKLIIFSQLLIQIPRFQKKFNTEIKSS